MSSTRDRTSKIITSVEFTQDVRAKRRGEACLVVIYGIDLGRRATLGRSSFNIGRSSRSDLPIDQESVSRHHARVVPVGRGYAVEDLGSTNGTFVNDAAIEGRRTLQDGDQITIGRSILKFMSGANIEANYHEEIYRLMTVDALTHTYNRRYFNDALEREFHRATRYKRDLSLCIFDIDHFKKVNDERGHVAGDAVLRTLAAEVRPRLREQDIFARVGGEEFAVLLPEVAADGVRVAGEKIRKIVEATSTPFEATIIRCTASVGLATLRTEPTGLALYQAADEALYAAKNGGRNRVEVAL